MLLCASFVRRLVGWASYLRPMFVAILVPLALTGSWAAANAEAPASGPYTIAVFISTDRMPEAGPEEVLAIKDFVSHRVEMLNAAGGVKGRDVEAAFYDDKQDGAKTIENVDAALADPMLIGMVGIWTSTRGALVVKRIGDSGVPFISEVSVETLFADYPNIHSLTRSVRDEQEVFASFAKDQFPRVVFIGNEEDLYTNVYHNYLEGLSDPSSLVASFFVKASDVDGDTEAFDRAVEGVENTQADIIFLSLGSVRGAKFLKRLSADGIAKPVFIGLGSINGVIAAAGGGGKNYRGAIYEIAEGGIANLNNERLEQLMRRPDSVRHRHKYSDYATGYGARYADQVAMIAEFANKSPSSDVSDIRKSVMDQLSHLVEGRRVWSGWAQDWTFSRDRASAERSLLVWQPAGEAGSILAPVQYVRAGTAIVRVPVLYVHLDMERIYRVDSNDKSFEAEFFFTMRSGPDMPMTAVEFTNAYHSSVTAAPLISIREVHKARSGETAGRGTKIYKVSGRFMFEPNLREYPFDEQVFSISFQPASTSSAFFLQPPSEDVRSHSFRVDGWRVRSHYVGTNEQIIRSIGGVLGEERIIPYYNFNYTWVMKRQVTDYVLRVIVPLTFIMIVAYLANFIPRVEFNAVIAIQVTALLSAIALYLALNQPIADDATLSDQIFVTAYATISAMIALSIFHVNAAMSRSRTLSWTVHFVQIYVVPIAALLAIGYVLASASSNGALLNELIAAGKGWIEHAVEFGKAG